MASSGSFNTSGYSGRYLEFAWSIKSQSIANNKTTISWTLTGRGTASSSYYKAGNFKVVIDGTTVYSTPRDKRISLYNGTQVASGEYTMTHDATGKKSFSASAQAGIYTYDVNCTGSGSWSLTDIPRQANITSAPNFTDIQNPTINYSNPAGNNVSSLQACISLTGSAADISYRDISKTGTSYTFNLTEAERNVLRAATPNSNTLSVRFYIKTVIGGNTFKSYVTKTMTIVNANPTVATLTYIDSNSTTTAVTQNNQILVQNLSTPIFTISNVNALKYATIKKYQIAIGEVVLGSGTGSAAHYDTLTINSQALNYSNNQTAVLTIEDSRGNKVTKNITLIIAEWKKPTAIINFSRLNNFYSDTDLTVDASFSSVDEKNTITIYYSYKKKSASSYSAEQTMQDNTTVTLNLDNAFEWDLKVRLVDKFSTVTYNMTVAKGLPIIFFDRLLSSTGFNCFPTEEQNVEVNGVPLVYNADNTYTLEKIHCSGRVSSSTKNIEFSIPIPRYIAGDVTSITLEDLKLNIRTEGLYSLSSAYVNGGYDVLGDNTITTTATIPNPNTINISMTKTSVYNGSNNMPLAVTVETITFSLA